jgi:hypothetical protein
MDFLLTVGGGLGRTPVGIVVDTTDSAARRVAAEFAVDLDDDVRVTEIRRLEPAPIAVGDIITGEDAETLPVGSVVLLHPPGRIHYPVQKSNPNRWGGPTDSEPASKLAAAATFRVLHIHGADS